MCLDGHLKLCDFGLAGCMLAKKKRLKSQEETRGGSEALLPQPSADGNEMGRQDASDDDNSSDNGDSASESSEEPEWTEDDATDNIVQGDLCRIRRRTLCGTAGYRPPEQVGERYIDYANRNGYDERVDYFSLGVTVFIMVCGRRPFPTKKQMIQTSGMSSPPSRTRRSSISDQKSSAIQRAAQRKLLKDIEYKCESITKLAATFLVCASHSSILAILLRSHG